MITQAELNRVICGDCAEVMAGWEDEIIDLTVTSPPYDNLRYYEGYHFDFEAIAKQLFRATKKGGVVVWVVGDATVNGSETGTSFRQALYFMELGFNLHDTMIWTKDGGGNIGSHKCYTQNFEYMFVLSKGFPSATNLIRDKKNLSAGKDKSGVGRRTANGIHKIEKRKISAEFSKRNNYWYMPPERGEHPAVFPEALARDHIESWSNPGDLVLDPMCGSGTTLKMAKQSGRDWIGIDTSEKYCKLSEKRIAGANPPLFVI